MLKTLFMIVLGLLGVTLFFNSLYYFGRKGGSVDFPNTISIINMAINFIMIALMLITIWINDKSLRENTEKHISALKDEVSKQIKSYQETSNNQILAIKESSENQINKVKEAEKERSRVCLLTLRKEIELNGSSILSIVKHRDGYLKGTHNIVTLFKTAAYEQGMVTNFIKDENLINEILVFYADMYAVNELIKMAINTSIIPLSGKGVVIGEFNKKIIEICDRNKEISDAIVAKLFKIEDELKNK